MSLRTRSYQSGLRTDHWSVVWDGQGDAKGRPFMTVTGSGWEVLGSDRDAFLRWLLDLGLRASRVDLAVDIAGLALADARARVVAGESSGRSSIDWHEGLRGSSNGRTLEVGRRASDRVGRLYDRRGPTRIEVELKRARARDAMAAFVQGASLRDLWRSALAGLIGFPGWAAWSAATA